MEVRCPMPFSITLHFVSDHDRDLFVERVAPRVRGHLVDPPADETADAEGYQRIAVAVTSQTAARDLCHLAFGFLAHMKNARIVFRWPISGGETQYGEVASGEGRDANLLSVRVGTAAKAFLDAEKEAVEHTAVSETEIAPAE
jgi:hypothetical protein